MRHCSLATVQSVSSIAGRKEQMYRPFAIAIERKGIMRPAEERVDEVSAGHRGHD